MKMAPADYDALSALIRPFDTAETRAPYIARDIPRADAVQDFDKRYRWDLLWYVRARNRELVDPIIMSGLYDDAHIDTALRKIVPPLLTESEA
jgi:hypothetical protein